MEIETDLSQKIVEYVQDFFHFFANQDFSLYSLILLTVAINTFTLYYIFKMLALTKECYDDIDNVGFTRINLLNLIAVFMVSQIGTHQHLSLNILCGMYIVPLIVWLVFSIKLFKLNLTRFNNKKNFVKKQKQKAEIGRQFGVGHRITKNDLSGNYVTAENMYKDIETSSHSDGNDVLRRRLNADLFTERND